MPSVAGLQHAAGFSQLTIGDRAPVACSLKQEFNARLEIENRIPAGLLFDGSDSQRSVELSGATMVVDQVLKLLI